MSAHARTNVVLQVSSSQGDLKQAFSVVDLMRRDRDLLVESRPSTFVFNRYTTQCCFKGSSRALLKSAPSRRLIIACGRNQSLGRAFRAFELMHEEGKKVPREAMNITTHSKTARCCQQDFDRLLRPLPPTLTPAQEQATFVRLTHPFGASSGSLIHSFTLSYREWSQGPEPDEENPTPLT